MYEVKCKLFKQINVKEISDNSKIGYDDALTKLDDHMKADGFVTSYNKDTHVFELMGQTFDAKGKIIAKTGEIINRTATLTQNYR
jgi:hypothetical protein